MAEALMAFVTAVVGGLAVALMAHYFAPTWLRKAQSGRAARAGLQAMRVYATAAKAIPAHQDLQIGWSQLCVEVFGKVAADITEVGESAPDLGVVASHLAEWLSQAPFLAGDDAKVNRLGRHLADLEVGLDEAIRATRAR